MVKFNQARQKQWLKKQARVDAFWKALSIQIFLKKEAT
jgi:hypothetical protein